MEDINEEADKNDEIMLPGFRFHPTDEELVAFYLIRKVQHKSLTIELITQLDIYKFDPWDLPKLARNGEKECYFYCPRDRKYRNSARPSRVTGAGFWKATGTDRPIYSSQGSKCIGLKKSLVFYRGRAARGMKTDWMMHEFRLPSSSDSVSLKTSYPDKNNIPANEAWAICRIFKKANSTKQRALSHSWVSPLSHHIINPPNNIHLSSSNNSTITMANQTINEPLQFDYGKDSTTEQSYSSIANFSTTHFPPCKPIYYNMETKPNYTCPSSKPASKVATSDVPSWFLDMPTSSMLGDFGKGSENLEFSMFDEQCRVFSAMVAEDVQENIGHGEEAVLVKEQSLKQADGEWETMSFPLSLDEAWKQTSMWDSSPCPSHLSTAYSTKNCYT